jgi:tRNA modification GTPase
MRPETDFLLDTIAALATPAGRSALAVVRLSGRETRRILAAVAGREKPFSPRRATLVTLRDDSGEALDRGLVTFFPEPGSYTGEDVAELSVHGSPAVAGRLLAALLCAGARLARPGEFTERAFHHGKMDLLRAEAVSDLIEARTGAAVRLSARRLSGALSARLSGVREDLLSAAARLSATIDFSEDVGEAVAPAVLAELASAVDRLAALGATYETGRLLSAGCRVAILGRPNAGKSTLFNALAGSARAIVTEVPGTTRDTLEAIVDVKGIPVAIVDTAGLRQTEDLVERIGVERARREGETADAILYVFDASQGWGEEDRAAVASFDGAPVAIVANKMDRMGSSSLTGPPGAMPLCGLAPDAGERLSALLAARLAAGVETETASEVLGSLRQRELVDRSRQGAEAALTALQEGVSPEYAVTHLHTALDALADVFGETTSEDVLQRIFSTFCIGK